jgi:hypothetical protein
MTVQYRVVIAKKDERVEGPDDADVVIAVPLAAASMDPTVAFMSGTLKATGHTGQLFEALASGAAADALARLVRG